MSFTKLRLVPLRPRRFLAALALLMALLASACSAGDSATSEVASASNDASFDMAESEPVSDDAAEAPRAPQAIATDSDSEPTSANLTGAASGGETEAQAQLPDLGRDIIFTATLDLAATDVTEATRQAIQIVQARGGFLFSQNTSGGTSVMTFKVLPDQFQAVLSDLGSAGTVRSQSISADDVTAVVVDLESRINTAEASVVRLRNLLDDASEIETIASLENQLLQRETTLEQLRGQLRTVRSQVDLATITVSVSELLNRPGITIEARPYAGHDAGFSCFDNDFVRSVEAGDAVTICYAVTNTGDTPLVDLTIDDAALGATIASMVVVDGTPTEIAPGESVMLAHEVELTEPVRLRTSVEATGIDADGNPIDGPVGATAATLRFEVTNIDSDFPSFGEVLSNSWSALVTLALIIALIAVAIAPFAAVALLVGLPLWWYARRVRSERRANATVPTVPPAPPGPPAPPASPVSEGAEPAEADTEDRDEVAAP